MGKEKTVGLGFLILVLVFFGFIFNGTLKLTPEDKINSAIPVSEALMNAETAVFERVTGPKSKKLEKELAVRLKLRALNCAKGYSPSWLTGKEEIRKNVQDRSCFINTDKEIAKWLGMVRAGLILAEPPLRPLPGKAPNFIVADGNILSARFAAKAGVALIDTGLATQVVDFEGSKPLFKEARESSMLGALSPNGRLFTVGEGNRLKIRESETGNVIAEIPSVRANQFFWVDDRTAFYSTSDMSKVYLVDFSTGKEIPVDVVGRGMQFATKVPDEDNQYVLFSYQAVTKIELDRNKAEPDVRLVDEKPVKNISWSNNFSSNLTADGRKVFSSSPSLVLVTLDSLQVETLPLEPFYIQFCNATPDPDKLILFGYTRTATGQSGKYYLFSIGKQTLMPVETMAERMSRYVYIPSIRQQAQVIGNKIAMVDAIPSSGEIPLSQFVSDALQAVNQSKLDAFDRQQQLLEQRQGGSGSYRSPAWPAEAPAASPVAPGWPMVESRGLITGLARNAQIESVGVYQGPKGTARSADGRNMGTVDVSIRRSSMPIVLVLSSYEPVQWNLKLESGAKLGAVLLSSYHHSQVVGAGSARTLVIRSGYAYKQGSAEYNRLNHEVLRWTGKTIGIFQGRYEGSSFSVGG